jgi:DNA-binding XRE family transcriptional regulator
MIAATDTTRTERGEFAREMTRRREALGYTKTRAARLAGISNRRWHHLENDREEVTSTIIRTPRPKPATVHRIAQVLKWDIEEAFQAAGLDYDPTEPPPSGAAAKVEEAKFIDLLRDIPDPRTREVLLKAMEDLGALPKAA